MRDDRGLVGIAVLWILAALTAMALAALAAGRLQAARGRGRLEEIRVLALAQAGFALARDADFDFPVMEKNFETGRIRVERLDNKAGDLTRARCAVMSGRLTKTFETGWRRRHGQWRAVYWREP